MTEKEPQSSNLLARPPTGTETIHKLVQKRVFDSRHAQGRPRKRASNARRSRSSGFSNPGSVRKEIESCRAVWVSLQWAEVIVGVTEALGVDLGT